MKMTPHILTINKRHDSDPRTSRSGRGFPSTDHNYRAATLTGGCGTPAKFCGPSFSKISSEYFSDEAPRSFAVEACVFAALILTVVWPIVNSVQAIAALIHSVGVL